LEEYNLRSLIVRFEDCEGPGLIEPILREKGFSITYHDAYKEEVSLIPGSHLFFDFFLFLGGSKSVYDKKEDLFFKPYIQLIENILDSTNKKILGICLGSQLLAKVLGAEVSKGEKGGEFGFGKVSIHDGSHPIFKGIESQEISTFHFHNDIFSLPKNAKVLLKSEKYENQMFSYKDIAFGILPHFEVTTTMIQTWMNKFPVIKESINSKDSLNINIEAQKSSGEIILRNIISL
jgi:GMP synthase-like glutamine amidotransferase